MNRLQTDLFRAGLRIFEDLGFMMPSSELDSEQANAASQAAVSIDFRGSLQGTLVLRLHGDILPLLAANMLGEDEPPSLPQQQDALRELANVTCGNLLPLIAGPEAVFDLGMPQVRDAQSIPDDGLAAARQVIGLEGGRVELLLFLSEGSCPHV